MELFEWVWDEAANLDGLFMLIEMIILVFKKCNKMIIFCSKKCSLVPPNIGPNLFPKNMIKRNMFRADGRNDAKSTWKWKNVNDNQNYFLN
jgi:hypothetical protein